MQLDGLHHITMITGDARRNVEFYAGVLGLRLVKKTVNFDAPQAYHLYFGDEHGSPGSILTWFEFAGIGPGRAGAGMIHTIELGVPQEPSLDFWQDRLSEHGYASERTPGGGLRFSDYDGLTFELVVSEQGNAPLQAVHSEVPSSHAITGLEGARALSSRPDRHAELLTETLGFSASDAPGRFVLRGPTRSFRWSYEPGDMLGKQGAGTIHHIAWHSADADHEQWRQRIAAVGMQVTPVMDRSYFQSIYFREPQGVLFELATTSPGFAVDEDPKRLGADLRLPAQHEHLRETLERTLTPLPNLRR